MTITQIEGFPYPHRIVSAKRRNDLKNEIDSLHSGGKIADIVFRNYGSFECPIPDGYSESGSLIITAIPRPMETIGFTWKGSVQWILVPPSYIGYWDILKQTESVLTDMLAPMGYRPILCRVPQKLAAVRSGLAKYGRNNIAYVPDFGSFHMLLTFYSDMPCPEDEWNEPELMPQCTNCSACKNACPTGAISDDSFIIDHERCITLYSGYIPGLDYPEWMDKSSIDCLIGCIKCQRNCPVNLPLTKNIEKNESFTEEETQLLRTGLNDGTLPDSIREKLTRLNLIQFFGVEKCLNMLSKKLNMFLQ